LPAIRLSNVTKWFFKNGATRAGRLRAIADCMDAMRASGDVYVARCCAALLSTRQIVDGTKKVASA